MRAKRTRYVGLNMGKKSYAACIMAENDAVLKELTYRHARKIELI